MNLSLREQLLKAGLVTEKQAKQAERTTGDQRHRQAKGGKRSPPPPPELTKAAQQAQDMAAGADAATRVANAGESAGRAAAMLKQAGLMR